MKNIEAKFRLNNQDEDINSMLIFKTFNTPEEYFKALNTDYSYTPDISYIESILLKTPKIVKIVDVFNAIKNGKFKEPIDEIRKTDDLNLKKNLKQKLPAIMFGATFEIDRFIPSKVSRLVCIDFDHVDDLKSLTFRLRYCSFVYMFFISPSGNGLKVIVRTSAKTEKEYKTEINKLFKFYKQLGLEPDTSKQTINDLCFYSYDPNAYLNTSATIWREVDYSRLQNPEGEDIVESVEYIIKQIENLGIDITRKGDLSWDIGLGLANKFGQEGREYFHKICNKNEKYNCKDCDDEYDLCINSSEFGSIRSLIWFADCSNIDTLPKPDYIINGETKNSEYAGLSLTKENILKATNGGLLFYKYLIPELRGGERHKKNVKNPFYNDTKGSLSIYKKDDRWYFYDHGEISFSGDVFDFAIHHYKVNIVTDFYKILININNDLNLGLIENGKEHLTPDFTFKSNSHDENNYDVFYKNSFSEDELMYWSQYKISKETLRFFNVKSVKKINLLNPMGKSFTFYSKKENPIFAYVYSKDLIKIYKPFDKKIRFFWIGNKEGINFFGYPQCQREEHMGNFDLIVTGGEKDVMTLYELDYFAISLNSETSLIPENFLSEIKYYYKSVLVLYDIDETGIKSSKFLEQKYHLQRIHLPELILRNKGKDVSDYLKIGGSKKELEDLITSASEAYVNKSKSFTSESSTIEIPASLNEIFNENEEEEEEEEQETENEEEPAIENDSGSDKKGDSKESDKNKEVFPIVSDKIIDLLPEYLKKGLTIFDNDRERDVFLYSSLGVISGFLPNVYGHYDGHEVFSNLYLLILAPPASNKSVAKWAKKMGENLHRFYKERFDEEDRQYKERSNKGNDQDNSSENSLQKPQRRLIFLPSNSSATSFLENLSINDERGILFETEADTLGETLGHDWGNYSDSLRKAFHHEAISYSRRGNKELIEISEPKLSVVLSGTPGQVRTLISNVENGLFSRFMFYFFEENPIWKDTFKTHEKYIYNDEFKKLGAKLSDFYRKLDELEYEVKFDLKQEQKEVFFLMFRDWLARYVALNGDSSAATSKRLGLITFRISMILSMVRYMDIEEIPMEVYCSDNDFKIALVVAENLLEHASLVFKLLPHNTSTVYKGSEIKQKYYDELQGTFSYQQSLEVADSISLKHKTAEKYLNEFIKDERLKRIEHGKYVKVLS